MRLSRAFRLALLILFCVGCARAQETRTGRPYSSGEALKRPPAPIPQAPSPVVFTDQTAVSRIAFINAASPTSRKYLLETMGGGVAMFDYDNDGRLDLFFTNGAQLADPMPKGAQPDKTDARFWNRLYRQNADGTFADVTGRANLKGIGYGMGAAAADYDGDGWIDLYVTGYGANNLYRNRGDGTFEDVTKATGTEVGGWSTSAGWFDYDRDGRLDLFVARYMDWDFEKGSIYCGDQAAGLRAYCHPNNFRGAGNALLRQLSDGTFADVSEKAGVADPEGKGLGVAFGDFDGDNWADVFVAHDSVRQSLYHNRGDGTFEDVALIGGAGYDENGKTFAGMGVDVADYDNDSRPDVFITTLSNETYPLYQNNGDFNFTYATNASAVGQITLLNSGWGCRFLDADNDGWRDLFVAQSHVLDTIEKTSSYLKYKQKPLLMRNLGGKKFVDVSPTAGAPFNAAIAGRGAAFGDLDNDGDLDAVINVLNAPPVVLRNEGTKNHWLKLVLKSRTKGNAAALGARVVIKDATGRTQVFDVSGAGSYLSSNDTRVNVGLGEATRIEKLEVVWPRGVREQFSIGGVDRTMTIEEGQGVK